jgi:hypothetical protein
MRPSPVIIYLALFNAAAKYRLRRRQLSVNQHKSGRALCS